MKYQVTKMYPPKTFYTEVEADSEEEAIEIATEYYDDEWETNPNDENLEPNYTAEEIDYEE